MREIKLSAGDRPVRSQKKTAPKKAYRARSKKAPAQRLSDFQLFRKNLSAILKAPVELYQSVRAAFSAGEKGKARSRKRTARRRQQPNWYRLALPTAIILAIALPVGAAGYYIVQNSVIERSVAWVNETTEVAVLGAGLSVQEVSVAGRERTERVDLMKALSVRRGDNILTFDPAEARQRVESLGWVETAAIMRRFPDEVFVRITERRPFARWQRDGKTAVIDRNGAVVSEKDSNEFRYLPKVVGKGANKDAAALFDVLAQAPTLFTRLDNAVRVRGRRWNLEFENGVTVLLPEQEAAVAWTKLDRLQTEKGILNKGVTSIDLRSKSKMYVRLKPDDAEFRRVAGKET